VLARQALYHMNHASSPGKLVNVVIKDKKVTRQMLYALSLLGILSFR
jgi:hypothetical protein